MGESILVDFSGKILEKLISLGAQEVVLFCGFKKDLADFQESCEMIQAVLEDAERQQVEKKAVKLWLEKLKGVYARADDVLDEILYETLRQKAESYDQKKAMISCCIPSSYPIAFRLRMAHKIKDINAELAKIKQQAVDFDLQKETVDARQAIQKLVSSLETDSKLDEFPVIGRESDAESLVKMIIGSSQSSDQRLSVIPVVAMGGLGKTTLAKLIYNDENVTKYFNARVWVCVSDTFDVKALLTQILKSVKKNTQAPESRQDIIQSLEEEFEGKKYLIVLDDVWNERKDLWDDFKSCMLKVNKGSGNSILLTTRSDNVASISMTIAEPYKLEGLSYEECWSIIKRRAFSAGDSFEVQELECIGIEIAKRCGGVPLVATVIGGMLRSKRNKEDWLSVQSSRVWNIEGGDRMLDILKLSFHALPDRNLKQCFAYCSIFRKDEEVSRETLIQLWMALGLLQQDEARKKEMEDVGDDFLKILVQRSLFQDVKRDEVGNITVCKMHDLVHDLALSLSKTEIYNSEASTSLATIPEFRHLADYSDEEGASTTSKSKVRWENTKHLHTLCIRQVDTKILFKLRGLRILILKQSHIEEVPDTIVELKHLRYFDLSECNICVLPKSISKLYHLQTLCLQDCPNLKELPTEIRNLANLRHLHTDVSFNLELLPGLRYLPLFKVNRNQRGHIGELGCLKDVRGKLKISGLEEVSSKEEAKGADLVGKRKLCQVKLKWDGDREESNLGDKEVLAGLECPPDLKGLRITGFLGDNFPEWVMRLELHNLVDISFKGCKRCEHVPMLGHLPFLQSLELKGLDNVRCIYASFYGDREATITMFRSLKSLKMNRMTNLETWLDAPSCSSSSSSSSRVGGVYKVFPCLEELVLSYCPKIKLLPSDAVRGSRLSLKMLEIKHCDSLETLPTCQGFTSLKQLSISSCEGLESLPMDFLDLCSSLVSLEIKYCINLTSLPKWHSLSSLKTLYIEYCKSLETIPTLQGFTSLEQLTISRFRGLKCLPGDLLDSCASLRSLEIGDCDELRSSLPKLHNDVVCSLRTFRVTGYMDFPDQLLLPGNNNFTCLESLGLGPFSDRNLHSFSRNLQVFFKQNLKHPLRFLELRGMSHWESIPEEAVLQHLTSLTKIGIIEFGIEALPDWFGNLSNLERIVIKDCSKLKHLPSIEAMQRLTKLSSLWIYGSPLLKEMVADRSGTEWAKIAATPPACYVWIDGLKPKKLKDNHVPFNVFNKTAAAATAIKRQEAHVKVDPLGDDNTESGRTLDRLVLEK